MDSRYQGLRSWPHPWVAMPRFYMPVHIAQGHKESRGNSRGDTAGDACPCSLKAILASTANRVAQGTREISRGLPCGTFVSRLGGDISIVP
ncbi:hypothetical protein VSDG_03202 [Cytospora chrysosperma]|uniref:Uncharacterized protein n=1 Tax=Cytospora chrysosperma TaxID=252740 RepID=A0A423WBB1_CYTCH|nr:hypothetical protein VSDG_03202 [Valsa sordida]